MENDNQIIDQYDEGSTGRSVFGLLYIGLLLILGLALIISFFVDYGYNTGSLDVVGFVAFLVFYFATTILMIRYVKTSKTNSLWADAWRRLLKNKLALFGLIVIWIIILLVVAGPSILYWLMGITPEYIPSGIDNGALVKSFPPSLQHLMGTDDKGRDLFARVLQGGRISLMVGIISTLVSLIVGVSYGATAGYLGGRQDNIMMRIVDIIYAIPYILIVIVLLSVFGGNNVTVLISAIPAIVFGLISFIVVSILLVVLSDTYKEISTGLGLDENKIKILAIALGFVFVWNAISINGWLYSAALAGLGENLAVYYKKYVDEGLSQIFLLFFALGLVSWLTMARVVRGQILSLKNQEFVLAARATGVSTTKIIFKHLVPNALGPVIVYATLTVPSIMLTEAFLSFLGMGVQAPYASWGSLAADGIKNIAIFPWQLIFPGVTMALTLFSLNFLGDGLRDALDPQTRKF